MRVCGVDDAGRGPVIGPLVIAGVIIEEEKLDRLNTLGVKDSKQLLSSTRTRLSKEIPGVVDDYHVLEIGAQELDRIVNRAPKFQRLNLLEARVMAQVIEKLRPELAYVDSSDVRTERFKNNILDCLSFNPRIISEHKADINYPIVSAASIMAKVHRDGKIEEIKREYGEIGSGYAHDIVTIKFLRDYYSDHGDFPPIVRRSWKTLGNIVRDLTQSTLA
ncbi:ribonuclease HII [archaeon 13_2_20CM_2_52_21]|nr:MAG: ribonuclease HII [archaeon 13_2_20CM_2_52_21]OLD44871.1 MAG: ribonuclease HII [archaeon 13_1_40CM_2_52_4]